MYGSCTGSDVGVKIACNAKAASDLTIGTPLVHIPAVTEAVTGKGTQGQQLLVCMQTKETGTGFVPLPAGGIIKTKTYMSIEIASVIVDSYSDASPVGGDWTWCS